MRHGTRRAAWLDAAYVQALDEDLPCKLIYLGGLDVTLPDTLFRPPRERLSISRQGYIKCYTFQGLLHTSYLGHRRSHVASLANPTGCPILTLPRKRKYSGR